MCKIAAISAIRTCSACGTATSATSATSAAASPATATAGGHHDTVRERVAALAYVRRTTAPAACSGRNACGARAATIKATGATNHSSAADRDDE
jgi:hypothetical protein